MISTIFGGSAAVEKSAMNNSENVRGRPHEMIGFDLKFCEHCEILKVV